MDKDALAEFGILGNVLISLTIMNGGKMEVSRDMWDKIENYIVLRDYDEVRNVDIFEVVHMKTEPVN